MGGDNDWRRRRDGQLHAGCDGGDGVAGEFSGIDGEHHAEGFVRGDGGIYGVVDKHFAEYLWLLCDQQYGGDCGNRGYGDADRLHIAERVLGVGSA